MKYALLSFFLLMSSSTTGFAENILQTAIEETIESHAQAKQSQQNIDTYADKTKDMLHEYRTALRKIDSLKTYNDQLEKLTAKQLETVDSLTDQISSIAETQQNIVAAAASYDQGVGRIRFARCPIPEGRAHRQSRINQKYDGQT